MRINKCLARTQSLLNSLNIISRCTINIVANSKVQQYKLCIYLLMMWLPPKSSYVQISGRESVVRHVMRCSYCVMLKITVKTRSSSKQLAYAHCKPAPLTGMIEMQESQPQRNSSALVCYGTNLKLLVQHSPLIVLSVHRPRYDVLWNFS